MTPINCHFITRKIMIMFLRKNLKAYFIVRSANIFPIIWFNYQWGFNIIKKLASLKYKACLFYFKLHILKRKLPETPQGKHNYVDKQALLKIFGGIFLQGTLHLRCNLMEINKALFEAPNLIHWLIFVHGHI